MQTASPTLRNIKTITELEKSALAGRSFSARIGDAIATQAGKMWFIVIHIVWFAFWLVLDIRPHTIFDPFPFALLSTIVSLESIFLSLFILMSQNNSNILAEQRNHLDLQINLLSEDENTMMLQMLRALGTHHKLAIGNDPEISALARKTEVNEVISELKEHLSGEE